MRRQIAARERDLFFRGRRFRDKSEIERALWVVQEDASKPVSSYSMMRLRRFAAYTGGQGSETFWKKSTRNIYTKTDTKNLRWEKSEMKKMNNWKARRFHLYMCAPTYRKPSWVRTKDQFLTPGLVPRPRCFSIFCEAMISNLMQSHEN